MTWPSDLTKANFDAGTDDPKQARSEFAANVDKVNQLLAHFSALAQTFVADTTAGAMRATIDAQQLIASLTTETAPATGDLIGIRDISAGADRGMTLANMLKVINGLSEDSNPDSSADFVATYDASGGAAKKVKLINLSAGLTFGTAVGPSGTATGFTGLPSGLNQIELTVSNVSTNGTSPLLVQIGDGGGYETSGYTSAVTVNNPTGNNVTRPTNGFQVTETNAANRQWFGRIVLSRINFNSWVMSGILDGGANDTGSMHTSSGGKTLSGTLDRIRLTTAGGVDIFDAGTINIMHQ